MEEISTITATTGHNQHQLNDVWTIWSFVPDQNSNQSTAAFRSSQRVLATDIQTAEDLAYCIAMLPPVRHLQSRHCYHVMLTGVSPEWEEVRHFNGGTWNFKVPRENADSTFAIMCACILGGFVNPDNSENLVTGITVRGGIPGKREVTFQIWHARNSTRHKLLNVLKEAFATQPSVAKACSGPFYRDNTEERKKVATYT